MGRGAAVAIAITLMMAAEAPAAARRPNMPDGWKWPPSREMRREGRKCLADLKAMGVYFKKVKRQRKITTPIVVPEMRFGPLFLTPTFRKPPFVMDCRLARGIAQHAELIVSLGVSELHFSTIHQYRKVRTRRGRGARGALSRHALGLAMDVFELGLADGTRVVVEDAYWINPTLILTEISLRATGGFRAILSPSVDPVSHRDHLHFEIAVEYPEGAKREKERKELLRKKRLQARRKQKKKEKAMARARAKEAKRAKRAKKAKKEQAQQEPTEETASETEPTSPAESDDVGAEITAE